MKTEELIEKIKEGKQFQIGYYNIAGVKIDDRFMGVYDFNSMEKVDYLCFLDTKTDKIYDINTWRQMDLGIPDEYLGKYQEIEHDFIEKVNESIKNQYAAELPAERNHNIEKAAFEKYITDERTVPIRFDNYSWAQSISTRRIMKYMQDPIVAVADYVDFLNEGANFKENTKWAYKFQMAVDRLLDSMYNNPTMHQKQMKDIYQVLDDKKTVRIKYKDVGTDGKVHEMIFPVDAARLRYSIRNGYSIDSYDIPNSLDKRKFIDTYGKYKKIELENIGEILHSKKVLYERNNYVSHRLGDVIDSVYGSDQADRQNIILNINPDMGTIKECMIDDFADYPVIHYIQSIMEREKAYVLQGRIADENAGRSFARITNDGMIIVPESALENLTVDDCNYEKVVNYMKGLDMDLDQVLTAADAVTPAAKKDKGHDIER